MEGYLKKKRRSGAPAVMMWQNRYFRLCFPTTQLYYYRSKPDNNGTLETGNKCKTIEISQMVSVFLSKEDAREFCIKLAETSPSNSNHHHHHHAPFMKKEDADKNIIRLRGKTEKEATQWKDAVEKAIVSLHTESVTLRRPKTRLSYACSINETREIKEDADVVGDESSKADGELAYRTYARCEYANCPRAQFHQYKYCIDHQEWFEGLVDEELNSDMHQNNQSLIKSRQFESSPGLLDMGPEDVDTDDDSDDGSDDSEITSAELLRLSMEQRLRSRSQSLSSASPSHQPQSHASPSSSIASKLPFRRRRKSSKLARMLWRKTFSSEMLDAATEADAVAVADSSSNANAGTALSYTSSSSGALNSSVELDLEQTVVSTSHHKGKSHDGVMGLQRHNSSRHNRLQHTNSMPVSSNTSPPSPSKGLSNSSSAATLEAASHKPSKAIAATFPCSVLLSESSPSSYDIATSDGSLSSAVGMLAHRLAKHAVASLLPQNLGHHHAPSHDTDKLLVLEQLPTLLAHGMQDIARSTVDSLGDKLRRFANNELAEGLQHELEQPLSSLTPDSIDVIMQEAGAGLDADTRATIRDIWRKGSAIASKSILKGIRCIHSFMTSPARQEIESGIANCVERSTSNTKVFSKSLFHYREIPDSWKIHIHFLTTPDMSFIDAQDSELDAAASHHHQRSVEANARHSHAQRLAGQLRTNSQAKAIVTHRVMLETRAFKKGDEKYFTFEWELCLQFDKLLEACLDDSLKLVDLHFHHNAPTDLRHTVINTLAPLFHPGLEYQLQWQRYFKSLECCSKDLPRLMKGLTVLDTNNYPVHFAQQQHASELLDGDDIMNVKSRSTLRQEARRLMSMSIDSASSDVSACTSMSSYSEVVNEFDHHRHLPTPSPSRLNMHTQVPSYPRQTLSPVRHSMAASSLEAVRKNLNNLSHQSLLSAKEYNVNLLRLHNAPCSRRTRSFQMNGGNLDWLNQVDSAATSGFDRVTEEAVAQKTSVTHSRHASLIGLVTPRMVHSTLLALSMSLEDDVATACITKHFWTKLAAVPDHAAVNPKQLEDFLLLGYVQDEQQQREQDPADCMYNTKTCSVLRLINQDTIAPAVVHLKKAIGVELPYQDMRSGDKPSWRVTVQKVLHPPSVVICHRKSEQSSARAKADWFSFDWQLTIVLDQHCNLILNTSLVVLDYGFNSDTSLERKRQVKRVLKPFASPGLRYSRLLRVLP